MNELKLFDLKNKEQNIAIVFGIVTFIMCGILAVVLSKVIGVPLLVSLLFLLGSIFVTYITSYAYYFEKATFVNRKRLYMFLKNNFVYPTRISTWCVEFHVDSDKHILW